MTAAHIALCWLVVVNLLFVQTTGIVDLAWTAVFCSLTLAAPLLVRLRRSLCYRLAWNAAVVILFLALVQRTFETGIHRMLEGGLVLAAFCQVHLVNNVCRQQRPDLLMFNSFLITLVTSFFCQQVSYSLIFVVYVFALLVTWRLVARAFTATDAAACGRTAAAVVEGIRHGAQALAATAAVFLLWPRDFEREGFVTARLAQFAGVRTAVDFDADIRLNRKAPTIQSERLVMRIVGNDAPRHWRGATFNQVDHRGWRATRLPQSWQENGTDPLWREQRPGLWLRPEGEPAGRCTVQILDFDGSRLPLPLHAVELLLHGDARDAAHLPMRDGGFGYFRDGVQLDEVRYDVVTAQRPVLAGRSLSRRQRKQLHTYLQVPPSDAARSAAAIAEALRPTLPPAAAQCEVVEVMRAHLASEFSYGLPGESGCATSIDEFLTLKVGHCEFFATTLALMLRSSGIPCRLVSGFLAAESDGEGALLVRAKHAHAWVEVFDPAAGWYTVDPTPPATEFAGDSPWASFRGDAARLWAAVTGFDATRRDAALAWLREAPGRLARGLAQAPWWLAAALPIPLLWWLARRRRTDRSVRRYLGVLRRLRLRPQPGETPRQLLERVRDRLAPRQVTVLDAATATHELARYRRRDVTTAANE